MRTKTEALINEVIKVISDLEDQVSELKSNLEYEMDYSGGLHTDLAETERKEEILRESMERVYRILERGDIDEARALMKSALYPKWHSLEQCQQAYEKEMAR